MKFAEIKYGTESPEHTIKEIGGKLTWIHDEVEQTKQFLSEFDIFLCEQYPSKFGCEVKTAEEEEENRDNNPFIKGWMSPDEIANQKFGLGKKDQNSPFLDKFASLRQ